MTNNVFAYNDLGIRFDLREGDSIVGNDVFKNKRGAELAKMQGSVHFDDNRICLNTLYDFEMLTDKDASLPGFCWCTTDSATIAGKIFDYYDDTTRGRLSFMPVQSRNASYLPPDPDTNCVVFKPVGIGEVKTTKIASLKAYPNPADGLVYFEAEHGILPGAVITLYDVHGRLVRQYVSRVGGRMSMDVSGVLPGLYIARLSNDGEVSSVRIVLSR